MRNLKKQNISLYSSMHLHKDRKELLHETAQGQKRVEAVTLYWRKSQFFLTETE